MLHQVISDFGFGRAKQEAEEFVELFEKSFYLQQSRVSGQVVQTLRSFPSQWQVHAILSDTENTYIGCKTSKPTYKEMEQIVGDWKRETGQEQDLLGKLTSEWQWLRKNSQ